MKTKLLRKIRRAGSMQIRIHSVTRENGITVGMVIGAKSFLYCGLFKMGDTEKEVINKAIRIYYETHIDEIRADFKKYSRNFKNNYFYKI